MEFLVLALLFVKHWYIDFVNQTSEEISHKGIYADWLGVKHSLKHGIWTLGIFIFFINFDIALMLAGIDFVLHYHIDYLKMKYGEKDIATPQFWSQLGLDQLAHSLTYLFLVWMVV